MPRILPRGEIEGLEHTSIQRLRFPERATVFSHRATRLRQLATDNPAAPYLLLMAILVDAQQQAIKQLEIPDAIHADSYAAALAHGMPPLLPSNVNRTGWRDVLSELVTTVGEHDETPEAAKTICSELLTLSNNNPAQLESIAEALLNENLPEGMSACAPFVMAALQVFWTRISSALSNTDVPHNSPTGVCPCCGSLPVASIVRIGGRSEGCRYLTCARCNTEWHMVRVICTHCENTENIGFHEIEGGAEGIKAESCDKCQSYRKIFYQDKQQYVDAVADDLASLALDVLMGEEGYLRASGNPLLWQEP